MFSLPGLPSIFGPCSPSGLELRFKKLNEKIWCHFRIWVQIPPNSLVYNEMPASFSIPSSKVWTPLMHQSAWAHFSSWFHASIPHIVLNTLFRDLSQFNCVTCSSLSPHNAKNSKPWAESLMSRQRWTEQLGTRTRLNIKKLFPGIIHANQDSTRIRGECSNHELAITHAAEKSCAPTVLCINSSRMSNSRGKHTPCMM